MTTCGPVEYVLDVIPFMVWQCNEGGTVTYANDSWINYTGLSTSLTTLWHTVVHPEDVEMATQAWTRCCTKKEVTSLVYRIRNATDGGYKWHQVTHHYDTQHNSPWWVGLSTEIPLSNNVNIPVREVEEMYWRVVEATAYPIITVDVDGVVFTFNQAAQDMFQYSPTDILGKPFADIINIHGATTDATSTTVQVSARRRDGTYIPVSLSVGQFQQFGRQLFVLVLHEADGEVKMQEELHKSKDNFLRNMSHELRTPLFGLLGTMSVMQAPEDPTLQLELKRMEECTWHLLSVVNNMIDFYKLENLYISPVPQPFRPHSLIADLCAAHAICVNAGVAFTYEVDAEVPSVVIADANFLKHAVSNVLGNAVRFTHEGAVHALVTADALDEAGKYMLNFVISDTGIGIRYDFYTKLFQPFMQMDSSDSRQYGGVGLGLAVSKHLVNLLGGTITFTSELGKGSEFVVSVPVDLHKDELSSSGEDIPFANTTPSSSPASSISGSPSPSPPHTPAVTTPTSHSPSPRHLRPHSLLSPISFSHLLNPQSGQDQHANDRVRSPASPAARFSSSLSPVISHSPTTPSAHGSPLAPTSSPSTLLFDSPFCSPAASPPRSPNERLVNIRMMHSISPIAQILPELSPTSSILQPSTPHPPFLLDAHRKLLSHLCPSDRPCPRCAFARPGHTSPPSLPAAPKSDPVSPRHMMAVHRLGTRLAPPVQHAPHNRHEIPAPQSERPSRRHIRSPSESSTTAMIAELSPQSSPLRSSLSLPALSAHDISCDPHASIPEPPPVGKEDSSVKATEAPSEEPLGTTTNTTQPRAPDATPPVVNPVIPCPPITIPTSPVQEPIHISPYETQTTPTKQFLFLRETQELIPMFTPTLSPPSTPTLSAKHSVVPIDLSAISPTLPDASSHLLEPSPTLVSSKRKPRVPTLKLSQSAPSTSLFYTTASPPPPYCAPPRAAATRSFTPESVPRLPISVQTSAEPSPAISSVLLSPPSFLRKLDEIFNKPDPHSTSAPTTPTEHSHPRPTAFRPRAASISVTPYTSKILNPPKSPRAKTPRTPTTHKSSTAPTVPTPPTTPTTPKFPTKSPNVHPLAGPGPLAVLANLFTSQASPTKSPSFAVLSRSSSFSNTTPPSSLSRSTPASTASPTPSPVPTRHASVSSNSDTPPSFYAPFVSSQTPDFSTKSALALSRMTSLPSLSKSHAHIRSQSPSDSNSSNSPLSPVLSFVPTGRASSSPSFSSIFTSGYTTPPLPNSNHSPPASPTRSHFVTAPEPPVPISPHRPLHTSLGTLLVPSPSSSLPTPTPSRRLHTSGPIEIANSPTSSPFYPHFSSFMSPAISPYGSPTISPTISPSMSPCISPSISPFSPRLCARENPTEGFSSYSPLHFLSTPPSVSHSPMSLASSPTSISSASSLASFLSGSPPSFSSSPYSPMTFASSSPPAASPPSPTSTHIPNTSLPVGLHILVVEDNMMNQNIIKKMLERVGWEVTVACNGREALDILFKEASEKYVGYSKFNIILMDCQMPILDGYQATRRIRKHEKELGQHMRIIAITASSHSDDERKCYEAGMDAFLTKPVTAQTLYKTISK